MKRSKPPAPRAWRPRKYITINYDEGVMLEYREIASGIEMLSQMRFKLAAYTTDRGRKGK